MGAVGTTEVATTVVELPPQRLVASVSTAGTALTEGQCVVVSGESLWSIASAALMEHLGTRPSLDDVDFYWRAVVTTNLPRLQSGDADLIFPGETVVLPDFDRP